MKTVLPRLLLPLFVLLLAACTFKPTVGEIRELVEARLQKQGYGDLFSVENVKKVNGYKLRDNIYVAEVEYDLVFRKSLHELEAELQQDSGDAPVSTFMNAMGLFTLKMQYGNFKAGDRVHKKESIRLIRTEKGWRILEDGA